MAMRKCRKQCETERVISKKGVDYFACVPDDILLYILILLPYELLRYKIKYVCRRWFNMITNEILFDQVSLIIQKPIEKDGRVYGTRLVDINERNLNLCMTEQELDIPFRGRIRSCCNELFLITDSDKLGFLYVFNHITKGVLALPPCSSYCEGHSGCKCGLVLAFDKFKGVYKVVHVYVSPNGFECEIIVLDFDLWHYCCPKWKKISGPSHTGERRYYWDDPVSVEGRFLHWDVHSVEYILSMDVVEERFCQTHLPDHGKILSTSGKYFLIEFCGLLSLLLPVFDHEGFDIWVLKDFQRKKWEKLRSITDLGYVPSPIYPSRIYPFPIGSLQNGSKIIFRKRGEGAFGLYAYNLKLDHMSKLDIEIQANECCLVRTNAAWSAVARLWRIVNGVIHSKHKT